tara:strand:- start:1109 stop:1309 length:201 start_codon:yes stop_codon:yes gene_type:complete
MVVGNVGSSVVSMGGGGFFASIGVVIVVGWIGVVFVAVGAPPGTFCSPVVVRVVVTPSISLFPATG